MSKRKDKNIYQHMAKRPKMYFVTYFLSFPDGETWVSQRPVTNDLDIDLKNLIKGHKTGEWKDRAERLWKFGDVWWKDNLGVEHRMKVETTKRQTVWGTKAKGIGSIKSEAINE